MASDQETKDESRGEKSKLGRPPITLDRSFLESLMSFRPSLDETATFFSVSADTIERRIKDWYSCTFAEFKYKSTAHIRIKLSEKAIDMAMGGNATMLIFCLKNYCGWSDRPDPIVEVIDGLNFVDSADNVEA
ncbi:MAG: hypothetical protein ABL927_13650 [Bdellovibrionales bacterium]